MNRDQKPKSTPRKDPRPRAPKRIWMPNIDDWDFYIRPSHLRQPDDIGYTRTDLADDLQEQIEARDDLVTHHWNRSQELQSDKRDLMRAASALCGLLKTTSSGAGFSREALVCLRDLEALLVDYDPTNV